MTSGYRYRWIAVLLACATMSAGQVRSLAAEDRAQDARAQEAAQKLLQHREAAIKRAEALHNDGKLKEAKAVLDGIMKSDPPLEGKLAKQAERLLRRVQEGLQEKTTADRRAEQRLSEVKDLYEGGKEQFKAKDMKGARRSFEKAKKIAATVPDVSGNMVEMIDMYLSTLDAYDAKAKQAQAKAEREAEQRRAEAEQRYERGVQLYKAGQLANALAELKKVEETGADLGWMKNRGLKKYLARIPQEVEKAKARAAADKEQARQAVAEAKALLKASREDLTAGRFDDARQKAKSVTQIKGLADAELRRKALALLSEIDDQAASASRENRQKVQAAQQDAQQTFDGAIALYKAGELSKALEQFRKVEASGVDLGWLKGRALQKFLARIPDEIEQAQADGEAQKKAEAAKAAEAKAEAAKQAEAQAAKEKGEAAKQAKAQAAEEKAEAAKREMAKRQAQAEQDYAAGEQLYESGQLGKALEQFRKVEASGVKLSWLKGRRLRKYLDEIPSEIEQAKADAEEQKKAAAAKQAEGQAAKEKAEAAKNEVAQRQAQAERDYAAGEELYKSGQLDKALERFRKVEASGANLGWLKGRALQKYLARIPDEIEQAKAGAEEQKKAEAAKAAKAKAEAAQQAEAQAAKEKAEAAKRELAQRQAQAEQTYAAAEKLYEAGQLDKALEEFRKVEASGVDMGWGKRRKLRKYLAEIPDEITKAKAGAEEQKKAEAAKAAKAKAEAAKQAEAQAAKEKAEAAKREMAQRRAQAEQDYATGEELYESGQLNKALEQFRKVEASGIDLGWFKGRALRKYLARIPDEIGQAKAEGEKKAEGDKVAKAEAAKQTEDQAAKSEVAQRQAQAEAQKKAEADRIAKAKAEAAKQAEAQAAREKAEAAKREMAQRQAQAKAQKKAEADRIAKAKAEADKAKAEAAKREMTQRQAQAEQDYASAEDLYKSGQLDKALEQFRKVEASGVDLSWLKRRALRKYLTGIPDEIAKVKAAAEEQEKAEADKIAKAKAEADKQAEDQAAKAEAEAAKREMAQRQAQAEQDYASAEQLYKSGQLDKALEQFRKVEASGVDMGWLKGRALHKYLARIPDEIAKVKAAAEEQRKAEADRIAKAKAEADKQAEDQAAKAKAEAAKREMAQRQAQAEQDYASAEDLYKSGQLDKALEQFRKVEASGADMGWVKSGKLRKYLAEIPEEIEKVKASTKAREQAVKQAQAEAASLLKASREDLAAGRFKDARKKADSVRKIKGLEDEATEQQVASLLAEIDRKQAEAERVAKEQAEAAEREAAQRKAQAEQTYTQAKALYESGQLDKALEQFRKVEASGVDLGWLEQRKLKQYLEDIPGEIQLAKARAQEQEQAAQRAKSDAAALLKASRDDLAAGRFEEARKKAESTRKVKGLDDEDLAQQAASLLAEIDRKQAEAERVAKEQAEATEREAAQRKAQAEQTFAQAEALHKSGHLDKALELFRKVEASGAELGWLEQRKLKGYLEDIPGEIQLAEARAEEQKQALAQAKSKAAALLKASREDLVAGRFEEAREKADSVRKIKGLEDQATEQQTASLLAEIKSKQAEAERLAREKAAAAEREAAQRKTQAEETFKAAVERYEADDLEKALEQFRKVEASGVDLGPFTTHRLNRHLSRLPGEIQEAKARAEEQRRLAEQARTQATALLKASREDLTAGRFKEARERAESALKIKGLTDADLQKQASDLVAQIGSKEAEAKRLAKQKEEAERREREKRKAEAERTFAQAEQLYRAGHLEKAQELFAKVRDSGVDLGLLPGRKLDSYLRRLPDEIKMAKARAEEQKRQAEAARKQAAALVQTGRDHLAGKRLEAALEAGQAAQKTEHLADAEVMAQAEQLVTAVRQAQAALEREAQQRKAEAIRLFDEGMSLHEAGKFKDAKEKLAEVQRSGTDIGGARQRKLEEALAGIGEDIVREQFSKARKLAQSILDSEAASAAMKRKAKQMVAQIDRREAAAVRETKRRELAMKQAFAEAVGLRRQGKLEEAFQRFAEVQQSGVNLGLLDARKLDRALEELPKEIAEAKAKATEQKRVAEEARAQALALIKQSRDLLAARRYDEAAQKAKAAGRTDRLADASVKQTAATLVNEIHAAKAKAKAQAEESFARAVGLYENEKFEDAQKLLTEVQQSGVPLGMLQERKLKSLLARIPQDIQEAKAREAERKARAAQARTEAVAQLKKSRDLLAAKRYDEAAAAARAVDRMEHLDDGAVRQETVALLKEIETKLAEARKEAERRRKEMAQLLAKGVALVDEQKLKEAKEVLTKVAQSGVDLGVADSQRLKNALADVEDYLKPVDEAALRQAKADLTASRTQLADGRFASARDLALKVRKCRQPIGYETKQKAVALLTEIAQKEEAARLEAKRKAEEFKAKMEQLFAQGVRLYEEGKLKEAKKALTEAKGSGVVRDPKLSSTLAKVETELAAQRKVESDLDALQKIMAQIGAPEVDEAAQREAKAALDAARATLAQGNFEPARHQAREVSESIKAIGEDVRQQAVALLSDVDKKEAQAKAQAERLQAEMKQLFDQAVALEQAGDLEKAHGMFVKVEKSGVDLGWLENQKLERFLKRLPVAIAEAKAEEVERQRLAEQAKADALACLKLSREHVDAKRFDKAREFAKAAQAIKGLDDEALVQQVTALLSEIDQKEAATAQQAGASEEAAKRVFAQAEEHYKAGELEKAHQLFTQVQKSGVDLGWLESQKLDRYLKRLPEAIAEAKAEEAERQRVAEQARSDAVACMKLSREHLEAGRFDKARDLAKSVRSIKGVDDAVKQQAKALLSEIDQKEAAAVQQAKTAEMAAEREKEQLQATAKQKYVEAKKCYESGELEKAHQLFVEVEKSGLDLGWLENRKLDRYLKRLPEAIAKAKEEEAERKQVAKQALERAQVLLKESRALLSASRFDDARERAESVAKIDDLDNQEAKQQASALVAEIATKRAAAQAAAAQAKQDFGRAVGLYRDGQLQEAQELFLQVRDTGADLGRRDSRALQSYLEKLPGEIQAAKEREAERQRVAQAARSKAQALLKESRELLAAKQLDEALAKAESAGKVDGLADEKLRAEAKAVIAQIEKAMAAAPKATPEDVEKAEGLLAKAIALCKAEKYSDAKPALQQAAAAKQHLSWLKRRKLEGLLASIDEKIAEQQHREKAQRDAKLAREREAEGVYKQVLAAMSAQQYQRAQQLIDKLKTNYSDTEFFEKVQ